jgi:hypothetical protein
VFSPWVWIEARFGVDLGGRDESRDSDEVAIEVSEGSGNAGVRLPAPQVLTSESELRRTRRLRARGEPGRGCGQRRG